MLKRKWLIISVLLSLSGNAAAQDIDNSTITPLTVAPIDYDAVAYQLNRASQPAVWQRVAMWFMKSHAEGCDDRKNTIDGNVGIGYSLESEWTAAAILKGRYLLKSKHEALPFSTTALAGVASVNGVFRLKADNEFVFSPKWCLRLSVGGGSVPTKFWGLGYEAAARNLMSGYVRRDFGLNVECVRCVVAGLTLGVEVDFSHVAAKDVKPLAMEYLQVKNAGCFEISTTGIGLMAEYDGRALRQEQAQGAYLQLRGSLHPSMLGDNDLTLWHVEATAKYHQPLWRTGTLALDAYADMWSEDTPWLYWAKVGGTKYMRGYYYGRYTDRKMVTIQAELCQKIYGILSGVAWAGAGSVFATYSSFDIHKLLPNYGVGLKMAVAGNMVLGVDYGFGRDTRGIIININDTF
ncbi:MAG: hypothetical protein IIY05_04120 [Alistipes sp.]|nr:hypothetical protein [Alistipes sp.]